jgi:hypothetical protein
MSEIYIKNMLMLKKVIKNKIKWVRVNKTRGARLNQKMTWQKISFDIQQFHLLNLYTHLLQTFNEKLQTNEHGANC